MGKLEGGGGWKGQEGEGGGGEEAIGREAKERLGETGIRVVRCGRVKKGQEGAGGEEAIGILRNSDWEKRGWA